MQKESNQTFLECNKTSYMSHSSRQNSELDKIINLVLVLLLTQGNNYDIYYKIEISGYHLGLKILLSFFKKTVSGVSACF